MLTEDLGSILTGKVAVVGVGDRECGDDGVGPEIASLLEKAGVIRVIDSGRWPELETWRLREISPDTVLFVDAVDFGGQPGEVALLKAEDMRSVGYDTHKAPLRLTMEYVRSEMNCRTYLLAVQPKCVRLGVGMSDEVLQSVHMLARILMEQLVPRGSSVTVNGASC